MSLACGPGYSGSTQLICLRNTSWSQHQSNCQRKSLLYHVYNMYY